MSTRVYLKPEVATKAPEGVHVVRDDTGRWYYAPVFGARPSSLEFGEKLPPVIAELIEEITVWNHFPACPRRTMGNYELKTAKATVDLPGSSYILTMRGPNWEDVQTLYYAIRAGNILPIQSWEDPQIKKSLLRSLKQLLSALLGKAT